MLEVEKIHFVYKVNEETFCLARIKKDDVVTDMIVRRHVILNQEEVAQFLQHQEYIPHIAINCQLQFEKK